MVKEKIYILGIESSCDDTAASVLCDGKILSNVVANRSRSKLSSQLPKKDQKSTPSKKYIRTLCNKY